MDEHPCLCDLPHSERIEPDGDLIARAEPPVPADADVGDPAAAPAFRFAVRTDVRSANYGNAPGYPQQMTSPPQGIMLHHTAGSKNGDLATLTREDTWVSSNDYVTKEPQIFELVPHPRRAWHAGNADAGTGYVSDGNTVYWGIEIENLGNGRDPYPKAQIDAVVWRCRGLRRSWPNIKSPAQLFRHRDFAPSRKSDPSDNFPFAEVRHRVFAATDPTDPPSAKPPAPVQTSRPELIYLCAWTDLDVAVAEAAVTALKSSGFPKSYVMRTSGDVYQASQKGLEQADRPCLVIGAPTVARLERGAREAFNAGKRDRLLDCVGKDLRETTEMVAWRLATLASRAGLDKTRLLAAYRANLPKGKPPPTKPTPSKPVLKSKVDKAIAYELELVDPPTVYGFWDGAFPFTPGPAMWANVLANQTPDPKTGVPTASCTGLINLGNAAAGISYRSGTLGYAKDLVNKRPYKPGMVVKKGEVLLDRFMETSNEDEGHIVQAIETGTNPRVVSSDHRFGGNKPGVNVHRLADSYKLFDYDYIGEVPGLGAG